MTNRRSRSRRRSRRSRSRSRAPTGSSGRGASAGPGIRARARRARSAGGCRGSSPPAARRGHAATRPSRIRIRRVAAAATGSLWVMTAIVVPARLSSLSSSRISAPATLSRLPVGSSARTIAGRPTTARAIATRCRSPPDSWFGRWLSRWPSPTRSSASIARSPSLPAGDPAVEQPLRDVLPGGQAVEEEELLEDEPDRCRPEARQGAVGERRDVLAVDDDAGRRSGARGCP